MNPLETAPAGSFAGVEFVLTDMDETLTFRGRLAAATYLALETLQRAGIKVIPVTAAPAGWCDQMARMWPVDAVIGENGGLAILRSYDAADRVFWSAHPEQDHERLSAVAERVLSIVPDAELAQDQPFRLSTLAFRATGAPDVDEAVEAALKAEGLDTTRNNLWVLGWAGGFDKLKMARRTLLEVFDLDIGQSADAAAYVGDSVNDGPMFSFFRHTFGVSTVRRHLQELPKAPAWITSGPGGAGFVEAAEAILRDR